MDTEQLTSILEAALLSADEPLSSERLFELFESNENVSMKDIESALNQLQTACENRPFELQRVASGWRYQSKQAYAPWIKKLWEERAPRYSKAFLETLALIAYRQPITRAEIEDIRGVSVNQNIIKTLFEREWIKVVGHRDVPGRPELLGTTRLFLDYFNLKDLSQLPTLENLEDLDSVGRALEQQLQLL